MNQRIDAVLFDFDHTLGVDHQLEERVLRLVADRHCARRPDDAQVTGALRRFRSENVPLSDALCEAFRSWGSDADVLEEYKRECLRLLPTSLEPMPGAHETLKRLRARGLDVAILTNGWSELQHAKALAIGFDGPVIVSEEIGAWKPSAEAFAIGCGRVGADPSRCAYVGDSPSTDVAGSKSAGMIAVWARLEGQSYPDGVTRPDHTVMRLDEVVDLCAETDEARDRQR